MLGNIGDIRHGHTYCAYLYLAAVMTNITLYIVWHNARQWNTRYEATSWLTKSVDFKLRKNRLLPERVDYKALLHQDLDYQNMTHKSQPTSPGYTYIVASWSPGLLEITGLYWRSLKMTGDWWRLMKKSLEIKTQLLVNRTLIYECIHISILLVRPTCKVSRSMKRMFNSLHDVSGTDCVICDHIPKLGCSS